MSLGFVHDALVAAGGAGTDGGIPSFPPLFPGAGILAVSLDAAAVAERVRTDDVEGAVFLVVVVPDVVAAESVSLGVNNDQSVVVVSSESPFWLDFGERKVGIIN